MDVSIIIVSYNTVELTRNCLKSVFDKTDEVEFDVWVVDNASKDNSAQMIIEEFPQVKLIQSNENLGFGRANNLAITKSKAKYVFLLNPDTVLINNAVKILFDFMENPENIGYGCCGGNLYDENLNPGPVGGNFPSLKILALRALGLSFCIKKLYRPDKYRKENEFTKLDVVIGADLMIRKEALDKSGLFDERFFLYLEETELQYRISKLGYSSIIVPHSKIIHLEGKSCCPERDKFRKTGELLFYKIHFGDYAVKLAKLFYILIAFKNFLLKFFSFKSLKQIKMIMEIKI